MCSRALANEGLLDDIAIALGVGSYGAHGSTSLLTTAGKIEVR
jgi:hypothetical protein